MRTTMVNTILACLLGCTAAIPAYSLQRTAAPAQAHGKGPLSPEEELQHLTEALKLSPEQQAKIKPILTNRRAQLTGIRADRTLSPEGKSEKMRALDEDANGKLMSLLTADQKPRYEAMVQHRKEMVGQLRARRSGAR